MQQPTKDAVALFGGSFDPVQNAHVEIIQKLSERFNKTIVVPSFISPFKKGGASASGEARFTMLLKALTELSNVVISRFELDNSAVSYSVDTAQHFKNLFSNQPLYWVIGSDMLAKLHKWHRFDELKTLVTFYIIGRPGFFIKEPQVRKLLKLGAKLAFSDFTGQHTSSAQARLDVAFGKYSLLPKPAAQLIKKQGLYSEFKRIVEAYPIFNLSQERIAHSRRTAIAAIHLAKLHNANPHDAVAAALLHDIAKDASPILLDKLGIVEAQEIASAPAKVRHAFYGAAAAKTYFKIRKKSIIDAIRLHTTGAPRMAKLAKIIFLADIIEQGRKNFVGLDEIRTLSQTKLNAAMYSALCGVLERLNKKGAQIYPLTTQAHEFYTPKKLAVSAPQKPAPQKPAPQKPAQKRPAPQKRTAPAPKAVAPLSAAQSPDPKNNPDCLANLIAGYLDEKRGRDVTLIDLTDKTIIADYFVIASVFSSTAVRALTDYVDEKLSKEFGIEPLRRDLDPKWAAIDYGSVILHIQVQETRDFYNLERLWSDGTNVKRL